MDANGPRTVALSPRTAAVRFFGAPLRKQTYLNLAYLALAFPLGLVYFVFVTTGLSVSLSLSILLVGIPLFVGVLAVTSLLATFERLLARGLLGVDVSPRVDADADTTDADADTDDADADTTDAATDSASDDESPTARVKRYVVALVTDLGTWKALFYLLSKFGLGLVSFVALVTSLTMGGTLLLTPTYYDHANVSVGWTLTEPLTFTPGLKLLFDQYLVGYSTSIQLTSWEITTFAESLVAAGLGVFVLLLSLQLFNALAWLSGRYAALMLSPTPIRRQVLDAIDA